MQVLTATTRGARLLLSLNWDRLAAIGVLYASLLFASWAAGG